MTLELPNIHTLMIRDKLCSVRKRLIKELRNSLYLNNIRMMMVKSQLRHKYYWMERKLVML